MKLKLSLDKNTIQTFFLENVEKIVLGGVVVCFLLMAYSSVGRDRFTKRTKDLIDSAANAERHWTEATKVEENEDYKKCKETDYSAIASRSQKRVTDTHYTQPVAWNRPVFEQPPVRGLAPTFPVEELRATAGRSPFQKAAGGDGPRVGPGVGTGGGVKGFRWAALIGAVPLKKQADAYKKAFEGCLVPNPQGNIPQYRLWYIERAEVTGRGGAETLKWEPIDFVEARKNMLNTLGKGQPDALDSKLMDARIIDREAVIDLPLRADRQSWEPKVVRHPRTVGPAFEDVQLDPKSYEGQKVTWQGEVVFTEGTRAVYSLYKVLDRMRPTAAEDNECFAVDYPTADAAKGAAKGFVTGIVKGTKVTVYIPRVGATGKQGTRPATVPLLQDASAPSERSPGVGEPAIDPKTGEPIVVGDSRGETRNAPRRPGSDDKDELPDYQLFRFIDFSVQPGTQYRYRVQALLKNPNYGLDPQALEKPELGEKPWIRTAWSEPSDVVAVPPDTRLLAGAVTPPPRNTGEPSSRIKIKKWVESNGIEASKEFTSFRGTVADYPNCTYPEGKAAAKPGKKDDLPGEHRGPVAADRVTPFRVDYLTGAVVLDMRGERISARERSLMGPGELLILDADGSLHVYNELESQKDYEEAAEPGEGEKPTPAPGPSDLPGDFDARSLP